MGLFNNPLGFIKNTFNNLADIPGSPEAVFTGLRRGFSGDLSWNPYSPKNSVWDVIGGGTSITEDPNNREIGRTIGTLMATWGASSLAGAGAGGTAATSAGAAEAGTAGAGAGAGAGGYFEGAALDGFGGYAGGETVSSASLDALYGGGAAGGSGAALADAGASTGGEYVPTSADKAALYGNEGYGSTGTSYFDTFASGVGNFFKKAMSTPQGRWGLAQLAGGLYGQYENAQNRRRFRMPNAADMPNMPGYQAGLEAVRRGMASRGYAGSTNMDAALLKYGGDFYNQFANQQLMRAQQEASFSNAGNAANLFGGMINAWGG